MTSKSPFQLLDSITEHEIKELLADEIRETQAKAKGTKSTPADEEAQKFIRALALAYVAKAVQL